jgi:hypothetical protein
LQPAQTGTRRGASRSCGEEQLARHLGQVKGRAMVTGLGLIEPLGDLDESSP